MIFSVIATFSSCHENVRENGVDQIKETEGLIEFRYPQCDSSEYQTAVKWDTVLINSPDDLINHIKSNRVLKLSEARFNLASSLLIRNIDNLKIIGSDSTSLMLSKDFGTVIKVHQSDNIYIENLILGSAQHQGNLSGQGVIRIEHSTNMNISNCKILGSGTMGLFTKDVCGLTVKNSEITACTALIFEMEKSRKIELGNSKFHNNNLEISVLGGFTQHTKEVTFTNCEFLNNKPKMKGNPAFNFNMNYDNFEEKIIFRNCTFQGNKGYKWYGDKIRLDNCNIDSTDFIGI